MRDVDAGETNRAVGWLFELENGAANGGLAAAGFADQPQRLAWRDRERHIIDRLYRCDFRREYAGAAERHLEIFAQRLDLQDRACVLRRGSRCSRLCAGAVGYQLTRRDLLGTDAGRGVVGSDLAQRNVLLLTGIQREWTT